MNKILKKILSTILIFSIFSTNVLAIDFSEEWSYEEWKLFAILLDKNLTKNSKIFDWVKKYWEEIQDKFPYLTTKIYLIDENEDQNSIFSKLEYLYFNWEKKWNKVNFLDWVFLIWNLPIPDIQIDEWFETKKSFFPLTDFEEKYFIYNSEKKFFIRQKEISEPKSEIFSWVLREKNWENNEEFYENYFERLNNFYEEWIKNFNENNFFFADLEKERASSNETLLSQYAISQNYQYEIAYEKYSSDLANKLQDKLIEDISETKCAKYTASWETVEKVHCVTPNPEALSKRITWSNLVSKMQIEKLLPEYYKTVEGFIQDSNDLIFQSWEKKDNLETIPKEIFIKDFLTKNFIRTVNELFEEKIITNLQDYTNQINQRVESLQNQCKFNYWNKPYNYNCDFEIPEKMVLEINNSPTNKSVQTAIQEMDMNLAIDIKNNIYFKNNWTNFSFYLPNLFLANWDLDKYSTAYLSYVNQYIKQFSETEFVLDYREYQIEYRNKYENCDSKDWCEKPIKKTFEQFKSEKTRKKFSEWFFNEIILKTKSDFIHFSDWLSTKDINEKRKKILEEKIFTNKEDIYENSLEEKEKFSTLYFKSWDFWEWENFYIEDIEKDYENWEEDFELPDFWDFDSEDIDSELWDKCWSYNWVPLPEWFDAIQCWLDEIKEFWETQMCWWWSSESWEDFWRWEEFEESLWIETSLDLKIYSYPEKISAPINNVQKILLESKEINWEEKYFFETFTIPEIDWIYILNEDIDSEKEWIQVQSVWNYLELEFKIEKEWDYKFYISWEKSTWTEIEIKWYEKLFFSAKQKEIWIIEDWSYNSVLLEFYTIDEKWNKVDFTWYSKLEFEDWKNWLINDEDLFFENWIATTWIISKEKDPILKIYWNWFQERNINLHFSQSWLAKDLIEKEEIPKNVEKIDVNWTNFYSAFLIWKEYANLKNWIAFKLLESWKAFSIVSSINNYVFYNEDYDYIENYENLKNWTEKSDFWIWFWDEEKSVMKFLSWDFIWNSVKSENWIFSVVLWDPMISFENKKDENEFTATIWKEIYKFSWDVDKIEIIDFNSDWEDDFLAFMKDWFIKLFKWENWSFIKKWDLAFFSANVEKSFIWDINNNWKDDFILKLYDWREYFFENKTDWDLDGKFDKNLLSESIIEKFLKWKTENFDIKKNILWEDDVKNNEYWKSDVQEILANSRWIDLNWEYSENLNQSTEQKLSEKIWNINEKLSEAVSFISNLTCMWWSCIWSPVNRAFLAPGFMTIPFNVWWMPIAYIWAPVPWSPAFWVVWWPTPPDWIYKPIPCTSLTCFWPAPWIPTDRHYIMPTITWWLWYAYCQWPNYLPIWSVAWVCFITALPINELWICEQKDPIWDAVQWAVKSFNNTSQSFKSWWKDWENSLFSQMIWSWQVPENEDAYISWLDWFDIKIFEENNETMNPFFSWFLTRWMDKQIEEISVNMLQLPTVKLILPDINSWLKSISDWWDSINLSWTWWSISSRFNSNLSDQKVKLQKYQNSLKWNENNKTEYFSTIKEEEWSVLTDIKETWENLTAVSKSIEETYDEIFKEIEKLPILQLKREKINLDIPWVNPYKLNALIIELDSFITRHEEILKDLPKEQFIYLRNYINTLKKNLEVLKTYRDFPQEIMKYRFLLSKYIWEIIDIIDCITDYLWWWIIKNKKIVISYIKIYYFIKQIIEIISNLAFIFEDYKQTCAPCKANTYLSNFSLVELFMALIPVPPIIKMPKFPDIKLDLSDIQLWVIVNIPEINFRVREIYVPSLNLPTLAFGNLNLPIFKLPPAPKLPELPEIPAIEIPKLPDLPPAPKLPEFPSFIADLTETIRLALKLYCLIFEQWLFVYTENTVKQVVEWLTNRSSSNYLPLDFLFLQFPNISFSTIREIQVNTHLELKFEDWTLYDVLKEKSDEFNETYKKLQNDVNNVVWDFNEKVQEEWDKINESTSIIFDSINDSADQEWDKIKSNIKQNTTW